MLIAAVVLMLLFLPWNGVSGQPSVVAHLLSAIQTTYAKFLAALSLPQ